jgi:hypothetical protein
MMNTLKKEFSVQKLSLNLNHGDSIYESWVGSIKFIRIYSHNSRQYKPCSCTYTKILALSLQERFIILQFNMGL